MARKPVIKPEEDPKPTDANIEVEPAAVESGELGAPSIEEKVADAVAEAESAPPYIELDQKQPAPLDKVIKDMQEDSATVTNYEGIPGPAARIMRRSRILYGDDQ